MPNKENFNKFNLIIKQMDGNKMKQQKKTQ